MKHIKVEIIVTDIQNVISDYCSKFEHHNDLYLFQIRDLVVEYVTGGLCISEVRKAWGKFNIIITSSRLPPFIFLSVSISNLLLE